MMSADLLYNQLNSKFMIFYQTKYQRSILNRDDFFSQQTAKITTQLVLNMQREDTVKITKMFALSVHFLVKNVNTSW